MPDNTQSSETVTRYRMPHGFPEPSESGDWVRFTDYDAAIKQRDRLTTENTALREERDAIGKRCTHVLQVVTAIHKVMEHERDWVGKTIETMRKEETAEVVARIIAERNALRERLEEAEKALEAAREVDRLYVSERSATPDPADTKWIMRVNAMNALHSALTPPTPPSTGGAK